MENPTIHTDFVPFRLANYNVNLSYKIKIDLSKFKYITTIDKYDIYESPTLGYVYVISGDFVGLGSIINFV